MKSNRSLWMASTLLLAGIATLALSQVASGSPAPATVPISGDYHHQPKPSDTPSNGGTPDDHETPTDDDSEDEDDPEDHETPRPTKTVTEEPTEEPEPEPTETVTPRPTNTRTPTEPEDDDQDVDEPVVPLTQASPSPTATTPPPTETPTVVQEERGITAIPNAGDGGLLGQHREGVAVLGFVLALIGVGLIAGKGVMDAREL